MFVPPGVCRESNYAPKVPKCFKFTMTQEELVAVELEGFEEVMVAFAKTPQIVFEEEKVSTEKKIIRNKKVEL